MLYVKKKIFKVFHKKLLMFRLRIKLELKWYLKFKLNLNYRETN